jgi:GNAT superfamily N-acetyltransferase
VSEPTIRRELRPGDLGRIVAHHGDVYSAGWGVGREFEAHVAAAVASAAKRGWPGGRDGVWIVEHEGRHAGSLALTEEPDGGAFVRFFVLDPDLRGHGLGRRLLGELMDRARDLGYERIGLETFSELTAAAHLYREHGFRVVSEDTRPRWGRDSITYQRYEASEAEFQRLAHERSSRSAGASARPFSVNA